MDDKRFDALARSLASARNRRQVLKGLIGLGGAVAATSIVPEVDAARRPTPTPVPVRCPGQQTAVGGQCVCQVPKAPGPEKCGPDCCNPAGIGAAHSECCDNACCFGHCYGEELCCPYPREFCPITGQCCPEGWTCCPDYGCISPNQCCTADDCPFQDCFAAVCPADHFCAYVEDCFSGGGECCDAAACFRRDCQNDGTCAEPVLDCRTGSDCCPAEACYRRDCQENGACSAPIADCREGEGCCAEGQTCPLDTGVCCTPLTCANVPAYTCPSNFSDGCGGFLNCSNVCDPRLSCVDGSCFNTSSTCITSYCEDEILGSCATQSGICLTKYDGSLVCTALVYFLDEPPVCGDCTSDAQCEAGDVCLANANGCAACTGNQGNGCGVLV